MRIFFNKMSWVGGLISLGLVLIYIENSWALPETSTVILAAIAGFLGGFLLIRILGWCFSVFPSNKDDAQIKDLERKVKIKELEKKLKD